MTLVERVKPATSTYEVLRDGLARWMILRRVTSLKRIVESIEDVEYPSQGSTTYVRTVRTVLYSPRLAVLKRKKLRAYTADQRQLQV